MNFSKPFNRRDIISLVLACAAAGGTAMPSAARARSKHVRRPSSRPFSNVGQKVHAITFPGSPFGIAWGLYYGMAGQAAVPFVPEIRKIGGGFTKLYIFWEQVEPQRGKFDWSTTDGFVEQLKSPDEGLISIFSSSSWATRRRVPKPAGSDQDSITAAYLPPSPARDPEDYRRFVQALVRRYRDRVRYWQNDAEPNNPLYWLGSKEEFVAQLKVFAAAVRSVAPEAVVVVGGYDGVFNPPGEGPPIGKQQAGLAFFDHVIRTGGEAFDVFDLRLYGDPYTITPRVEYIRSLMAAQGYQRPFMCTEYDGPIFFEFAENLQKVPEVLSLLLAQVDNLISGTAAVKAAATREKVRALLARKDALPLQAQMFWQDAPPWLDHKFRRLQVRDTVIRNVFALSAGVQKTVYWQLKGDAEDPASRDDVWSLVYGKIGLIDIDNRGRVWKRYAHADAFARLAENLTGVRSVERIAVDGAPNLYLFRADRANAEPTYVVWDRRNAFAGEDEPPVEASWPWRFPNAKAIDALGSGVSVTMSNGHISLPVSATPIFVHPAPIDKA